VPGRPAQEADAAPRALILVRNTVSHDTRVLREVQTLRDGGFAVLVAGVVSVAEPARRTQVAGVPVLRLDPRAGRPAPVSGAEAAGPPEARRARGRPARRTRPLRPRLRRLAVTASYHLRGARLALRVRPALVHANDYNTMWIALAAKLLCGSAIVYDCHELWADRNRRPEWRPWLVACEALFVRLADATITSSPGYAAAIAKRYRVRPPLVVRNIPAQDRQRPRRNEINPSAGRAPLVVYIGGLMPGRGLEPAIRAAALVPELRLRMIGPGHDSYRAALARCAIDAGVGDRVELRPAVAPSTVIDAIADADIGLMLIEPICPSYELTLPNKLFEYVAAGLPILSSDLAVTGPLIRAERLGEVVDVDDVQMIAGAIRRLVEPNLNRRFRERVNSFADRVTWEHEQAVLERVYTDSV
jgi:glycosyltransferase involved in cell wall biosynthesis